MTENKLKNMIENHELDNLMTNSDELEKLKSSKTTEQVLEILKKYNYTETKEVFERELLEILQSIKLKGEEMKRVSGGRILNTKNLSVVLGSLMALNSAGFMSAGAVTEEQKNTKKYSVESLLNKVDTQTVEHIGLGAAGIGLIWAIKEIVTTKRDNATFNLTSIQQQIYSDTKKLSEMILEYVRDYIRKQTGMPAIKLKSADPAQKKILELIREIRNDWLAVYEDTKKKIDLETKKEVTENRKKRVYGQTVYPVDVDANAVENVFYGLPVKETLVIEKCRPYDAPKCTPSDMVFLALLSELEDTYRKEFEKLKDTVTNPDGNVK